MTDNGEKKDKLYDPCFYDLKKKKHSLILPQYILLNVKMSRKIYYRSNTTYNI